MPSAVAILIILCAGLFVGSRLQGAHEARSNFNAYRTRTARGFNIWIKSFVVASLGVVALLVLVYLLIIPSHLH